MKDRRYLVSLALKLFISVSSLTLLSACTMSGDITSLDVGKIDSSNLPSLPIASPVNKVLGTPYFNRSVSSVVVDRLGRKTYGGQFTQYTQLKENYVSYIARLNTDGSIDSTFQPGLGFDGTVNKIIVTPDPNQILVAGEFFSYRGAPVHSMLALKSDATLSSIFSAAASDKVLDVAATSDGKYVAIGTFYYWNDNFMDSQRYLVRVNSDGSRDSSLAIGTSLDWMSTSSLAVQKIDNKILVGGTFLQYNGTSSRGIARINTNGSYDASFVVGTGFNGDVRKILALDDGNIVTIGTFTTYKGNPVSQIALLGPTGAINAGFNTSIGTSFNVAPSAILNVPGVGLYVGGSFNGFNGQSVSGIVCLTLSGTPCSGPSFGTGFGLTGAVPFV